MINSKPPRKPHILITDDESNMIESLEFILEAADFRVSCAQNGLQAFDIIRRSSKTNSPVDLLITDIRMPLLSGSKLMERLRDENIDLPTIIISEYDSQRLKQYIQDKQKRLFISKPFTERQLLEHINTMINIGSV